jgi:hypothetical protein
MNRAWLAVLLAFCSCQATIAGTWTGRLESPNSIAEPPENWAKPFESLAFKQKG